MRVFPISSLTMPVNLIQYRGTVGMFNNGRFSSNSLNYSYLSKKYYNDETFTLAIGLIILALWHLMYVLEIQISISSRPGWYLQFFKEDAIFKYDRCLRSPHLAQSHYYQAKW